MDNDKFLFVQEIETQARNFLNELEKYRKNPTKAGSKRMRLQLNEIKKCVTEAKRELLAADKGEN